MSSKLKWPKSVTLVRHGESEYNVLKEKKEKDPLYRRFRARYDKEFLERKGKPFSAWFSKKLKKLAEEVWEKFALRVGDHATGLTKEGTVQAFATGKKLKSLIHLPDVAIHSPYVRAEDTLKWMALAWKGLQDVRRVPELNVVEQEHGTALLYNDKRVFFALNPEQLALYELEGPYYYRWPQGEAFCNVRQRSKGLIDTLTREYSGRHVLVVTHHLTILSMRANLERWGMKEFMHAEETDKPKNCGVTTYRRISGGRAGRLTLMRYNEVLWP